MEDVELEFSEKALDLIAKKAIERKTGARGLRSIIEETMLDIMYEIPSRDDIVKCIIDEDTVINQGNPILELKETNENKDSDSNNESAS